MVNLNETQSTLRRNVEREKAKFDAEWEAEVTRHRLREEELKRPVRQAVAFADQAGVPSLQIAKAAGFNQTNQLLNWMRDKSGGNLLTSALSTPVTTAEAPLAPVEVKGDTVFLEVQNGVWEAHQGSESVRFTLYNYEGTVKVAVVDGVSYDWFEYALEGWAESQAFTVLLGWPNDDD